MIDQIATRIRKIVRFIAALGFWLNAALVVALPRFSFGDIGRYFHLTGPEAALVVFFGAMAVLNSYGFDKFFLDVLYIYTFPFIFAYHGTRLLFKVVRLVAKIIGSIVPPPPANADWKDVFALVPIAQPVSKAYSDVMAVKPTDEKKDIPEPGKPNVWRLFWESVQLPFTSFTFVWGLLASVAQNRLLLLLATFVLIGHTLRFIIRLASAVASVNTVLSGAEKRLFEYIEKCVERVRSESLQDLANKDLTSAVTILILVRALAFIWINRAEITYGVVVICFLVYAVVYFKLALLFGFVYLGLAKLQRIPWSFLESMIDSLAMPLSFTFFPRSWPIQSAELVHSFVVIILGVAALAAYMRRKIDDFREAAQNILVKLDDEALKAKINELWQKMQEANRRAATGQR